MLGRLIERAVQSVPWKADWAAGNDVMLGPATSAGVRVDGDTALGLTAFFSCVSLISDAMSLMPVDQFRRVAGVQTEVSPRARWLDVPNAENLWGPFVTQITWDLLTDGNCFIAPTRDASGAVVELWPLDPRCVVVERPASGGPRRYLVDGRVFTGEMVHIPAYIRSGGLRGINPVSKAAEAIGLGLAAQQYGSSFFGNSAVPSVVIEAPGAPTPEQLRQMKENWFRNYGGSRRSNLPAVLAGGATAKQMTVAPEQSQFLETRQFNASEIASIFHVPPDLVNIAMQGSGVTYQNLESRWTDFVRRTLLPWMKRIEDAFSWRLMTRPQFMKFVPDAFLRADTKTRYETHAIGIGAGFLTVNEARQLEDYPPVEEVATGAETTKQLTVAEVVQKVYLGVGTVITPDEARLMINAAGGDLDVPGPIPAPSEESQ